MAVDIYLVISGIPGESTFAGFSGAIEVLSFSSGINQVSTGNGSGGSGAGKPQFSDVSIVKHFDLASPLLMKAVAEGTHLPKMVLSFVKSGGAAKPFTFLTYELDTVFVTSIQDSASVDGDGPTEAVSFAFEKILVTYTSQGSKLSPSKTETFSFDLGKG